MYKNWKKPIFYGLITLVSCWFLFQDWGTVPISPGAQSNERWGFPTSHSALTLGAIFAIVIFIITIVKKFRSFYGNSSEHPLR